MSLRNFFSPKKSAATPTPPPTPASPSSSAATNNTIASPSKTILDWNQSIPFRAYFDFVTQEARACAFDVYSSNVYIGSKFYIEKPITAEHYWNEFYLSKEEKHAYTDQFYFYEAESRKFFSLCAKKRDDQTLILSEKQKIVVDVFLKWMEGLHDAPLFTLDFVLYLKWELNLKKNTHDSSNPIRFLFEKKNEFGTGIGIYSDGESKPFSKFMSVLDELIPVLAARKVILNVHQLNRFNLDEFNKNKAMLAAVYDFFTYSTFSANVQKTIAKLMLDSIKQSIHQQHINGHIDLFHANFASESLSTVHYMTRMLKQVKKGKRISSMKKIFNHPSLFTYEFGGLSEDRIHAYLKKFSFTNSVVEKCFFELIKIGWFFFTDDEGRCVARLSNERYRMVEKFIENLQPVLLQMNLEDIKKIRKIMQEMALHLSQDKHAEISDLDHILRYLRAEVKFNHFKDEPEYYSDHAEPWMMLQQFFNQMEKECHPDQRKKFYAFLSRADKQLSAANNHSEKKHSPFDDTKKVELALDFVLMRLSDIGNHAEWSVDEKREKASAFFGSEELFNMFVNFQMDAWLFGSLKQAVFSALSHAEKQPLLTYLTSDDDFAEKILPVLKQIERTLQNETKSHTPYVENTSLVAVEDEADEYTRSSGTYEAVNSELVLEASPDGKWTPVGSPASASPAAPAKKKGNRKTRPPTIFISKDSEDEASSSYSEDKLKDTYSPPPSPYKPKKS